MKRYLGRILLCVIPVLFATLVVGWAYAKYQNGEGGFRLGVDLSGGTILVYEVDWGKMSEQARSTFKAEDLAASLKRRIDPADLYNVTIRPVPGDPPRVEIILPTGGRQQSQAADKAWKDVVAKVKGEFKEFKDKKPEDVPYDDIPQGQFKLLIDRVVESHPTKDGKEIESSEVAKFINALQKESGDRRTFTGEEIENIKNLIQQQGRLEFRILANKRDDAEAINAAIDYFKDPKNEKALKDAEAKGDAPPAPTTADGSRLFTANLHNETSPHPYSWVEVGKEELYSLHLNSGAEKTPIPEVDEESIKEEGARRGIWAQLNAAKDKEPFFARGETLLYCRTVTDPQRIPMRDREMKKQVEFFYLTRESERGKEVTGDFLTSAGENTGNAKRGVSFSFNSEGAGLFQELTTANQPINTNPPFRRMLAVVLDSQIRSVASLNDIITSQGQITGEFTPKAVEDLVRILRAGALPATLKHDPVSENTMGATLGEDTIFRGALSIGIAFIAVMAFMLVYYRFAGVVACIALMANLLLTVAFMVIVQATFTLPGLAGLVLMLGMAVDANVLIYERLREERERGASLALAIRNGYDRAFPTIIDTHMTSIFTAIVLYVVGNDQLKGFGISLTVGLIISLFTSLFMTRTIFDFCMSQNWIHSLYFMQLFRRPNIDFMRIRYIFFTGTVIATILGAALFIYHLGNGGLNIDFVGGTAYTGQLTEAMDITELRKALENQSGGDPAKTLPDLSIESTFTSSSSEGNKSRLFTVRTSDKDRAKVQRIISDRLGDKLKRIEMKDPEIAAKDGKAQGATLSFVKSTDNTQEDFASRAQVTMLLSQAFKDAGLPKFSLKPAKEGGHESEGRYSKMELTLDDPATSADLQKALKTVQSEFRSTPQPERLENFDRQVASDTQQKALIAIVASWAAILMYLWFRFGSWTFGMATVLCLVHDLFFTLGTIALCHYIYLIAPGFLGISDFKIDLQSVAALLTLVGYSVSDTIVVFDRIREVRGKNPMLTYTMINDSVNQTLSRTILSSLTVFLVVGVLYIFGGEGVHLFAFVMVVGVIVGTYSSIYIASPLLIMFGEGAPVTEREKAAAAQAAAAQAAAAQA